jgi:hypothetical protein
MGRLSYRLTEQAVEQNKQELTTLQGETPFLKAEDSINFRVLPNLSVKEGESWFKYLKIHNNLTHKGKFVYVKCLKSEDDGAACPICSYVAKLYEKAENDSEKKIASNIQRKNNWFVPVYIRDGSCAGQVRWWKMTQDNIKKVNEFLTGKRTKDCCDIYDGTDFILTPITKAIKGGKPFKMIDFKLHDDNFPLDKSDDAMEKIIDMQEPLESIIKVFAADELKTMLENYIAHIPGDNDIEEPPAENTESASQQDAKLETLLENI